MMPGLLEAQPSATGGFIPAWHSRGQVGLWHAVHCVDCLAVMAQTGAYARAGGGFRKDRVANQWVEWSGWQCVRVRGQGNVSVSVRRKGMGQDILVSMPGNTA